MHTCGGCVDRVHIEFNCRTDLPTKQYFTALFSDHKNGIGSLLSQVQIIIYWHFSVIYNTTDGSLWFFELKKMDKIWNKYYIVIKLRMFTKKIVFSNMSVSKHKNINWVNSFMSLNLLDSTNWAKFCSSFIFNHNLLNF